MYNKKVYTEDISRVVDYYRSLGYDIFSEYVFDDDLYEGYIQFREDYLNDPDTDASAKDLDDFPFPSI